MRMSWFDASGIASLAKTALKEAQKTIDKALDIKDEDDQPSTNYTQVSPVEESENFFSSWGLKSPTRSLKSNTSVELEDDANDSGISEKAGGSGLTSVMTSSLWGSFTGSFFENARSPDNDGAGSDSIPVSSQPKRSQISSIAEDASIPLASAETNKTLESHTNGGFERRTRRPSKNVVKVDGVVEGVDDEEVDAFSDSRVMLVVRDEEEDEDDCSNVQQPSREPDSETYKEQEENTVEAHSVEKASVVDKSSFGDIVLYDKFYGNRLEKGNEVDSTVNEITGRPMLASVELALPGDGTGDEVASPSGSVTPHTASSSSVSSPSSALSRGAGLTSEGGTTGGKRSSESVEVLGSCEEGCATSPEGDLGTAVVESVPVHLGPHGRNPPFNSVGFIRVHTGESLPYAKSGGAGYDILVGASKEFDESQSSMQDSNGARIASEVNVDGCFRMGVMEEDAEKGSGPSSRTKDGMEGPTATSKLWECGTEAIEAISGHGSPESVEVIPEDRDVATSPSSVEVIGGSASSTTPSISASTSTRPSSSSSSISPTTPGSGSSGFAHLGIRDDVAESSVIHSVVPESLGATSVENPPTDGASETAERRLDVTVDDMSPESVEVIPEEVEEEELSSSASSTTTTTAVTVLEQQKALAGVDTRSASVLVTSAGSMERSSKEDEMEETRSSLESFKGKEICDNGGEKSTSSTDELKTSSYLRTLLADAMLEKEEGGKCSGGEEDSEERRPKEDSPQREHSPLSSERSDLVKVGEEEMSGQTSGDEELDTTTSSDIEIISSPNGGDSGSNRSESRRRGPGIAAKLSSTSRQGPMGAAPSPSPSTASSSSSSSSFSMVGRGITVARAQRDERQLVKFSDHSASVVHLELREPYRGEGERGHHLHHYSQRHRFPSSRHLLEEQATAPTSEVEELSKRMSEISDILEARESKLIELSRTNVELQEQNLELMRRLKEAESKSGEREGARVEFEGRLATLDRKLQQANSENEVLKMRLKEAMEEVSRGRGGSELAALLKEKEEECRELREEGEKLSKQEMNLTTMLKNLRAAQRNSEKIVTSLRQRLEESENEVERVKKSLGAREGVERAQVEAIHNLKSSLEASEKEKSELHSRVENERKALKDDKRLLEEEKDHWNERERELLSAVEFGRMETERLRDTLTKVQEDHARREEAQRMERLVLERRLVEVESRGEEVGAQASRATRPLLRQLESLQTMARQREAAWEATERELLGKLAEAEGKAKVATERERSGRQRCATLTSRVSSLESQLLTLRKEVELEASKSKEELERREREVARLEGEKVKLEETLTESKRSNVSLEECLSVERAAVDAEKRRNALLQDQLREHLQQKQNDVIAVQQHHPNAHRKGTPSSPRSSPTLSFGHASLDDSITSSAWLPLFQEDGFHEGRSVNSVFEGHAGIMTAAMTSSSSSTLIENLQSQLKLRDGEVQQMQWELGRGESERSALTGEVSSLTAKLSEMEAALALAKADSGRLSDLQTKYDALLQMYGEKVEETEELRLDLQDIKEMYKTQIDQLTKKGASI